MNSSYYVPLFLCFALMTMQWACSASRITYVGFESPYFWSDTLRPRHLMVIGDLQPTTWLERTFLGRIQNDAVRQEMIKAVVQENPDLLLLLGDQVAEGEHEEDWHRFDSLMVPITARTIPVYPVIGNHDYGLMNVDGAHHFRARFPYASDLPQLVWLANSVALIVLNSNVGLLPAESVYRQAEEYQKILETLDTVPEVRGVIVASHHPPFTNASLAIDKRVHDSFVPPFLNAEKTILFLSGHIHSYERFLIEGKTFVVSGGGGGPRRDVDTSARRAVRTDQFVGASLRPHHYLQLRVESKKIVCRTIMFVDGEFKQGDSFQLLLK